MQKRGFTIIELAIALSVSFILAGIAIPRFNTLLDQQDFFTETEKVAACIQAAQSMAAAPTAGLLTPDANNNALAVRWTAASLSGPDDNNQQTCSVMAFDASNSLSNLVLNSPNDQLATPIQTTGISNLNLPQFRIYFGVTEKGVPVEYLAADSVSTRITSTDPTSGMPVSLAVASVVNSTLTTNICVGQGGAPVIITSQSCL